MVSSIGEAAMSGVSLVDNIMVLLISAFSALAAGGAVVASQYLGQKDAKSACKAANQLFALVAALSLVIMAIVYLAQNFILDEVFGDIPPEVRRHASTYLSIVTASIPAIAIYNAGAAIFRTMGKTRVSMNVALLMNGINISLSAVMLYGLHCGTEGVAIPTLVARVVAAGIITILARNPKGQVHIWDKSGGAARFDPRMAANILGLGLPYGLENSLFQLGRIIVLRLVASFGTSAIAANSVGGTLAVFEVLPGVAINLGMTAIIARCVGAGDFAQVRYYNKNIIRTVYLANLATNLFVLATLPLILRAYNLSAATAASTRSIVFLHAALSTLIWPIAYTLPVTLRSSGDAKFPMATSILTMFVFRIGMAYLLGDCFGMGLVGTWLAMFVDWFARAAAFSLRYSSGKWMSFRLHMIGEGGTGAK